MENMLSEKQSLHFGLTLKVTKSLHHEVSDFQTMDIVETPEFGRVMLIDGEIMVTEKDEFVYHEMLAHPALFIHPNPKKVLIIGGGNGGTLREVCRHSTVERAVLCEIDEMVIKASKEFFPLITEGFSNPKTEIFICDGMACISELEEFFDVILVDSTDLIRQDQLLFEEEFLQMCEKRLVKNGILALQCECLYIREKQPIIRKVYQNLHKLFPIVAPYLAPIHTYQTGLWMFMFASKQYSPNDRNDKLFFHRYSKYTEQYELKYFNEEIRKACFALPNFVRDILGK